MTLHIVGMTCAFEGGRGLVAFARRVCSAEAAVGSVQETHVTLDDLVLELHGMVVALDTAPPRIGVVVCGEHPAERVERLAQQVNHAGTVVPVAVLNRTALVPALELAAMWFREQRVDLVVLATEGPLGGGAVLLTVPQPGQVVPAHAVVQSLVEGPQADTRDVFYQTLTEANLSVNDIGMVESVPWPPDEDVIRSYRGGGDELSCAVSSLGESPSALPLLSLIKAALCVERRMWVPTPSVGDRQPEEDWRGTPLFFVSQVRPWLVASGNRRFADVAYGVDDRVGHVVLAEPDVRFPNPAARLDLVAQRSHLIPVVGSNEEALQTGLADVRQALASGVDVATVAARRCRALPGTQDARYAIALVGRDREEILKELDHAVGGVGKAFHTGKDWLTPRGSAFSPNPLGDEGVTFVYPGVFNSYVGLAGDVFQLFPWLHERLGTITTDVGAELAEKWLYPRCRGPLTSDDLAAHMERFRDQPTAMIESGATVAIAHTMVMRELFGVEPSAALGYSMGEVSMLWASGVWRDADAGSQALHTSPLFDQLISGPKSTVRDHWQLPPDQSVDWATYLLKARVDRVREAVREEPRVHLTFVNLDSEVVIAGDAQGCRRVVEALECHALPVPASVAIHNEAIDAAYDDFVELYSHPVAAKPDMQFYSAADYGILRLEERTLARAMATMCCRPVDFPRLIGRAYEGGARVFLELGPLATCTRRIKRILRGKPHVAVAVNPTPGEDLDGIVRALAVLVAHRVPVALPALYDEEIAPAVSVHTHIAQAAKWDAFSQVAPRKQADTTGSAPAAGVLDFYTRRLFPQQQAAAQVHRDFLRDRESAQVRAGSLIALQVAAGRGLLGEEPEVRQVDTASKGSLSLRSGGSPRFDEVALREFAAGDVVKCFGADFVAYRGRRLPRIPNGDLLMMSRVMTVEGELDAAVVPVDKSFGASLSSEFDIDPDVWFYQGDGYPGLPPNIVLMEMALQPCGFLSAYLRSSLLDRDSDLYFRNLDGYGRVLADMDLRGKTVRDQVRLLSSTRGQGVIIQAYEFTLSCEGTAFYEGWSSFGYFPLSALKRQVGLDLGNSTGEQLVQTSGLGTARSLVDGQVGHPHLSFSADRFVLPPVDAEGLPTLTVVGHVTPHDWYFRNHFYQDPVMPGSLGVEAGIQAMVSYARQHYPALARGRVHHVPGGRMSWKYRGQITPEDTEWRQTIRLTDVQADRTCVTLTGDVTMWKADIPIYRIDDVVVRVVV